MSTENVCPIQNSRRRHLGKRTVQANGADPADDETIDKSRWPTVRKAKGEDAIAHGKSIQPLAVMGFSRGKTNEKRPSHVAINVHVRPTMEKKPKFRYHWISAPPPKATATANAP